jgi:hypothetical protein
MRRIVVAKAGDDPPPAEWFFANPSNGRTYAPGLDLELSPEQPDAVADAIETLVVATRPEPDPWWRAGLDEALTNET